MEVRGNPLNFQSCFFLYTEQTLISHHQESLQQMSGGDKMKVWVDLDKDILKLC